MNNLTKISKCMKLDSISNSVQTRGETPNPFLIAIQVYNTIVRMWSLATEVCLSCLHSQSHRLNIQHTDEATNY